MNLTRVYMPGRRMPLGLATCTSVRRVLDPASKEFEVRVTLPGKVRLGNSPTVTSATCPTATPGALVCGTEMRIRSLLISATRNISPPRGTSVGDAVECVGPWLDPVAEMRAPTSTFLE